MLLTVNRLGRTNISLRRSGRRRWRRSRAGSAIDPGTLARTSGTCHGRIPLFAAAARFGRAEEGVAGQEIDAAAPAADRIHVVGEVSAEPVPQERRRRQL